MGLKIGIFQVIIERQIHCVRQQQLIYRFGNICAQVLRQLEPVERQVNVGAGFVVADFSPKAVNVRAMSANAG